MLEENKVYNMDCLDGLRQLKTGSVQAIITDPPYFQGLTQNGQRGDFADLAITKPFWRALAREINRVLTPTGEFYIFMDWRGYAFYYETFKDNQKPSITVQNTGKVDAYLRVRLVTYWVNDAGEIVAKPSMDLTVDVADGWLEDKDNDTYYYQHPVKPGESTDDLLKEVITLETEDGYNPVIEVFAEAIQAEGTTDVGNVPAVTDAWGVTITDGVITAVN